jgi:hypothetical protein
LELISQTSSLTRVIAPTIRSNAPTPSPIVPESLMQRHPGYGTGYSAVDLPLMKENRCLEFFTLKMKALKCIIRHPEIMIMLWKGENYGRDQFPSRRAR